MNELSLFSGSGGGLLGTKLLGFRAIGYVEWDPYCQAVIAQRIKDGFLEEAPIFGDIREFVKSGAAREYRGFADVVTAGFPCQPFSVAGKQAGADDPRNMWPATADVLRAVRPRFALLENVPGLLATGYCERIFADLAALGFDAEWGVFSAAGSGAPHRRERLFIVAHAQCPEWWSQTERWDEPNRHDPGRQKASGWFGERGQNVAHARHEHEHLQQRQVRDEPAGSCYEVPDSCGEGRPGRQLSCGAEPQQSNAGVNSWWDTEPDVGRVAHGVAARMDRLKALGNGQVSAVVARAWGSLT